MPARIARASALLITAAFVACTDASPQEQERRRALADAAHRSLIEWFGPVADATPPPARSDLEILRSIAAPFWSGPRAPQFAGDPRFTDSLIAFSVDRLWRQGLPSAQPLETASLDTDRTVLALFTLERYLGWPVLQRALAEFRARFAGRPATAADLIAIAGAIAGRNLTWMQALFDRNTTYDYALDRVETQRVSEQAYQVDVVVKRHGTGMFTGTSAARAAAFDAGRGVTLLVTFAGGEAFTEAWDGRDAERHFRYESSALVISAVVDPDAVIAVDQARANNVWTAADAQNRGVERAAVAWGLRWAAWLQDRLLLWSVLW